jgi:hypothetical protein
MLAHLTAITDLTGLPVECLSVPARGTGGAAVGVGVAGVAATMVAGAGAMDGVATAMVADSLADADMRAVRLAASTGRLAVDFMAAVWPTLVEGSTGALWRTAVEGSTAAVVDTAAADTGNRGGSGVSGSFPGPARPGPV